MHQNCGRSPEPKFRNLPILSAQSLSTSSAVKVRAQRSARKRGAVGLEHRFRIEKRGRMGAEEVSFGKFRSVSCALVRRNGSASRQDSQSEAVKHENM